MVLEHRNRLYFKCSLRNVQSYSQPSLLLCLQADIPHPHCLFITSQICCLVGQLIDIQFHESSPWLLYVASIVFTFSEPLLHLSLCSKILCRGEIFLLHHFNPLSTRLWFLFPLWSLITQKKKSGIGTFSEACRDPWFSPLGIVVCFLHPLSAQQPLPLNGDRAVCNRPMLQTIH